MSHVRLVTTTRNEAETLPALAKGCDELGISSWVILDDLESTDNTHKVAKQVFGHLPGKVIRRPASQFKDENGFFSLSEKRNWLYNLPSTRRGCDYLFITASDEPPSGTLPNELFAPVYDLVVDDGCWQWPMPLLIRSDIPLKWVGTVHEFLDHGPFPRETLPDVTVHRHTSSATYRDRLLQIKVLKAQAHEPRWAFYLAQTLKDVGRTDEAIGWYLRRARMVGFDQETFMALYMAAWLMEPLNVECAITLHVRAMAYRSHRPEPYYHLYQLLTQIGSTDQAKAIVRQGAALPCCPDELFLNRNIESQLKEIASGT